MRRKKVCVVACLLILAVVMSACGSSVFDSGKDGYVTITDVDGVSVDIMSTVARNATAVTSISEDMSFERDQTYLYKDGENNYFIFNIDSLVFVLEKGTKFGFRDVTDKGSCIENDSIFGVWLDNPHKKLEYKEDAKNGYYKMVATVNAAVSITPELYNDFTGKMAYLSNGTTEWTMFVGTIGTDYDKLDKDMKKVLEYMAASMTPYNKEDVTEEYEPEISLGGMTETDLGDVSVSENESVEESTTEETTTTEEDETKVETEDETEDETEIEIETETEPETETVENATNDNKEETTTSEEEIETVEVVEVETENPKTETNQKPVKKGDPLNVNNQKEIILDDNKIYSVDIYSMLPLNKKAYASVYTGKRYENAVIKIDKIITGKDAVNIIKDACKNGSVSYEYFEPSDGCTWHIAHYTMDYSTCSSMGYMNIKLRGLDGENLRYRGITYSPRTYDIKIGDNEYYSYYSVPNGCDDYALECGEGTVGNQDTGLVAAYYRIKP